MKNDDLFKIITLQEAAKMWGKDDSTLRRVITGPQFKEDVDFRKTGKIWLIKADAMERVYGAPLSNINNNRSLGTTLKRLLNKVIRVEQDYSRLTDEQLKMGFVDSLEYIISFNKGLAENIKPELPKEKAFSAFIDSINLVLCELKKRNITKIEVPDEFYGDSVVRYIWPPECDIWHILSHEDYNYKSDPVATDGIKFILNRLADENIAFIGHSGCGKTIIAKVLIEKFVEKGEKVLIICGGSSYYTSKEYIDSINYLNGITVDMKLNIDQDISALNNIECNKYLIFVSMTSLFKKNYDSAIIKLFNWAEEKGFNRVIFDSPSGTFFEENADYFIDNYKKVKLIALSDNDEPFNGEEEGYGFRNIFPNLILMRSNRITSANYLNHYSVKSDLIPDLRRLTTGAIICIYNKCQAPVYSEIKLTEDQLSRYSHIPADPTGV